MKRIHHVLLIALLFSSCNKIRDFIPKQPAIPEFNKTLGGTADDVARSVIPALDGGYIMAGYTESINGDVSGNHGFNDAWVVHLNKRGEILWQRALGGSDYDVANFITHTPDGGYILAGGTDSNDGDVSGQHGNGDAWVVKLNPQGGIQWQRALGGSSFDAADAVIPALDGGFVMAGHTSSNDGDVSGLHGSRDAWVVRLDNRGNIQWQKTLGGSGAEIAHSISTSLDGGYLISGYTESNDGDVSGYHGGRDAWVVKLDRDGGIQWQRALGGSGYDIAFSHSTTPDGGYILAGRTDGNDGDVSGQHGNGDAWIVRLDKNGYIQWQKTLGGSAFDQAISITNAWKSGFILAGQTRSNDGDVSGNHGLNDAWVVKLNPQGAILWQKTLGGPNSDGANAISRSLYSGYIMAGSTQGDELLDEDDEGLTDAWVVTLND